MLNAWRSWLGAVTGISVTQWNLWPLGQKSPQSCRNFLPIHMADTGRDTDTAFEPHISLYRMYFLKESFDNIIFYS